MTGDGDQDADEEGVVDDEDDDFSMVQNVHFETDGCGGKRDDAD